MSISLLDAQSSEILTLSSLMPYSSVNVETNSPIIGWINTSLANPMITLQEHCYAYPDDAMLLKNTIQKISRIASLISTSIQLPFPLKISCLFNNLQTPLTITHPIHLLQFLSSALGYLKTQVCYSSLRTHVSAINKKSLLSDIVPSILAAQNHLKIIFLDLQATSPIKSSLHSFSPPSLTTLASLAVLKLPTIQHEDSVPPYSGKQVDMCFDEHLQNHSAIKKLSPLLRSIFKLHELFNIAHESLELRFSLTPNKETSCITLEATYAPIASLNLLSFTTKWSHIIATTRIIQSQIAQQALASPLINPSSTSLSMNVLTSKLLGNNRYLEYEKLVIYAKNFRLASLLLMSPRDDMIINVIIQMLSNFLSQLSKPVHSSNGPLNLSSTDACISSLSQYFSIFAFNLYTYLQNPSLETDKMFLSFLRSIEKRLFRTLNYLQKAMVMNQELWLKDFFSSLKSTITTTQSRLKEKASSLNMTINPNPSSPIDPTLIYSEDLPTGYIATVTSAPITHSCLKKSSLSQHPIELVDGGFSEKNSPTCMKKKLSVTFLLD
ncbi:hypothetical protein CLAVI_000122 [Candidatus Clavichlamydia salmonicola]|uniref:hypothetical protein n=1 Tax=Candidatus Clavichlamydia salmonicola TaxID=469812 RepID=UPI001891E5C8|nr:hypothetical protein [Candidatus Clavichlamydia salmonicola]MBF5050516.1 hypothetical protein [Candidatus Clavichlamydia salmonicola]